MLAAWPEPADFKMFVNDVAEHDFELAKSLVSVVRSTRARYRLSPKEELDVAVRASVEDCAVLEAQHDFICGVGRVGALTASVGQQKPEGAVSVVDGGLEVFVVVGGLVDLAAEVAQLRKGLAKAEGELAGVTKTLGNAGFVAKAAPAIIERKRSQQAELEQTVERLKAQIADLA